MQSKFYRTYSFHPEVKTPDDIFVRFTKYQKYSSSSELQPSPIAPLVFCLKQPGDSSGEDGFRFVSDSVAAQDGLHGESACDAGAECLKRVPDLVSDVIGADRLGESLREKDFLKERVEKGGNGSSRARWTRNQVSRGILDELSPDLAVSLNNQHVSYYYCPQ